MRAVRVATSVLLRIARVTSVISVCPGMSGLSRKQDVSAHSESVGCDSVNYDGRAKLGTIGATVSLDSDLSLSLPIQHQDFRLH